MSSGSLRFKGLRVGGSILNLDLYVRFSISEGMCMKLLSKEEISTIKEFLKTSIPEYILTYSDGQIDLLDCYEDIYFCQAIKRKKDKSNASPWGR